MKLLSSDIPGSINFQSFPIDGRVTPGIWVSLIDSLLIAGDVL